MHYREIAASLHAHTVYSEGAGTHREVAAAAGQAGLDLVVATDHNVWVDGVEGYYEGVLLLVGEEVYDVRRTPPADHLLVYGAETEMANYAEDPQRLIEEVNRRGGLCFPAHPFGSGDSISFSPWTDWGVTGYAGLEVWPGDGLRRSLRATLRRWDELLAAGRRITAIGGADVCGPGPQRGAAPPRGNALRRVSTHLLIQRPLSGDLEADKSAVYDALRAGRAWVGYDWLAPTRGFVFQVRSGANRATVGEELVRAGAIIVEVTAPAQGDIRLLWNGRAVARARGTSLRFTTAEPGVYRAEVHRSLRGRRQVWILSNPIYVQ